MADDAAGAVRRTPRPTRDQLIEQAAQAIFEAQVFRPSWGARPSWDSEVVNQDSFRVAARALADVGLLADPGQRRPVVLLRAEDCACPVGGDCPHGPEPVDALDLAVWLHAKAAWQLDASERRRTAQAAELTTSGRVRAAHVAEIRRITAERDALQARIDEPCAECRRLGRRCTEARKRARTAESERDKLKAVVGNVLQTLDHHAVCCFQFCPGPDKPYEHMRTCRVCSSIQDLRAALQGDQPTEPDSWESGAYIEPGIGGVANVSTSGWPGGVERVWLRVSDYARKDHGADIVLEPDEADEIAGVLRGAAQVVRRDRAEPTGEADRG